MTNNIEETNSDKKTIRNLTTLMFMIYLICFMLVITFSNKDNHLYSILSVTAFVVSLLLLFLATNNYFLTRLEDAAKNKKTFNLTGWDISAYILMELFSIGFAFLFAVIFYASFDLEDSKNKETLLDDYLLIGISLFITLALLIIFYGIEKKWYSSIYEVRQIIESKYNVANIVNILTGICTLFVFVAGIGNRNTALNFGVLAIVYTYYIFYNSLHIKHPQKP